MRVSQVAVADAYRQASENRVIKNQLIANLSQELWEPLAAALDLHRDLQRSDNLTFEERERVLASANDTRRLMLMLDDVNDLCELETDTLTLGHDVFEVNQLVHGVAASFAHDVFGSGIELIVRVYAPVTLMNDSQRLSQILTNLIQNACRNAVEGCITVEVSVGERTVHNKRCVTIAIEDDGPGLRKKDLRLNDVSARTVGIDIWPTNNGSRELRVAQALADFLGAELHIKSTPGKGTIALLVFFSHVERRSEGGRSSGDAVSRRAQEAPAVGLPAPVRSGTMTLPGQTSTAPQVETPSVVPPAVAEKKNASDVLEGTATVATNDRRSSRESRNHILVVEDVTEAAVWLQYGLETFGVGREELLWTRSLSDMMTVLNSPPMNVDLVLLDMSLSDMSVPELSSISVPVVLMSHAINVEAAANALGPWFAGHVRKPVVHFTSLFLRIQDIRAQSATCAGLGCITRQAASSAAAGGVMGTSTLPGMLHPRQEPQVIKCLLVDDNPFNLEMLKRLLSLTMRRVESHTFQSARTAIEFLAETPHKIDVIFLDIHMPDMDGCQAAKIMRGMAECKGVKLVATTADARVLERCRAAGFDDFLPKPHTVRDLKCVLPANKTNSNSNNM